MAYMDQDRKSKISPLVKRVLAKYGVKGTLSVRNHSTLALTITSGRINFCQNWADTYPTNYRDNPTAHQVSGVPDHIDVNVYHIDTHFSGRARQCLKEILAAMNQGNWDRSDIQTDYFDVGWYVDINVGKWNKPYIFEKVGKNA